MRPLIGLILIVGSIALAQDRGPKFGPEFTFPKTETDPSDWTGYGTYLRLTKQHLVENQPVGAKFATYSDPEDVLSWTKFTSPNGWTMTPTSDPGVVEVRMDPLFVDEYERFASDIQDAVFVTAYNEGMFPSLYLGGGHINIDMNYFYGKPPLLFRNFLVDWINHSSLTMGIFGYDTNNALPFIMNHQVIEKFEEVLAEFDQGKFGKIQAVNMQTVQTFCKEIYNQVRMEDDALRALWGAQFTARAARTLEVNVEEAFGSPLETRRLEIRAVRPQASVDVWIRQIKLIRDRILFLQRSTSEPIRLHPSFRMASEPIYEELKLDPPMTPQLALREFYQYVTETGHKWSDHRDYLWPAWTSKPPGIKTELQGFEESKWFREREKCPGLLKVAA